MREVKLPSGAVLKVKPAPFEDAKNLFQALLKELKSIPIDVEDTVSLYKNLFCVGFSSEKVEECIWKCLERCTYNNQKGSGDFKITKETFEPVEAREDYMDVCVEVVKDNVLPFVKTLTAKSESIYQTIKDTLK